MQRQIFLFTPISDWTAQDIVKQLLDLDRENNDEITMYINSPGGSVISMFAITDIMNIIKSKIRTIVIGQAASAAAVIAACGNVRLMTEESRIMVHEAWGGAFGSISQIEEQAEEMRTLQTKILNLLSKKIGKSVEDIDKMIRKTDKFFSAKESKAKGFVDDIIKGDSAQVLKLSESINVEGYEIKGKEVQILREGKYLHPVYGDLNITEDLMYKMKENFEKNVRGCDISYDYTHDNDSGEKPAAFWVKNLIIRQNDDLKGKGLFATVEFTPMGEKKISEKEYKYSSADFRMDYIDQSGKHHPYVLCGGTLTNRPFIKNMNPIKLSENYSKEAKSMNKDELIIALKSHGVDVTSMISSTETLNARVKELESKITELNALPAQKESEIKALKDSLAEANNKIVESEKTSVFECLVAEGKCTPAQKDSVFATFKKASDISAFYNDAPIVVSTKAKGNASEHDEELTEAEAYLVQSGEYTKAEIIEARQPVVNKQ